MNPGTPVQYTSFPRRRDKSAQRVERPEGGPQGERSESSRVLAPSVRMLLDSRLRGDDGMPCVRMSSHDL